MRGIKIFDRRVAHSGTRKSTGICDGCFKRDTLEISVLFKNVVNLCETCKLKIEELLEEYIK